ncbi:MAG: hypothetical protein U0103_14625 [Candidatus Obscuribacterales bacterium]
MPPDSSEDLCDRIVQVDSTTPLRISRFAVPGCFLAVLLGLCLVCTGSSALNVPLPWTVTIGTHQLKECLDFPNSKVQPFIKTSVYFEQPMEHVDSVDDGNDDSHESKAKTHYEDIYFGGLRLLGLRRASQLQVEPGAAGVVKIERFEAGVRTEEAAAASRTIARIYLDLYLRRASLKYVEVALEDFDLLISELNRYGFRPSYIVPERPVTAMFLLNVRSETGGKTETLVYAQ